MDSIVVTGNGPLEGQIPIAGAKNACLTLMPATLLSDEPLTLTNAPRLSDIKTMTTLLQSLGAEVVQMQGGQVLALSSHNLNNHVADYDIVRKMRAGILVLGPLLAKHHKARVSLPGGCAIGTRPVDLHLKGLTQLGAEIELESGYIVAAAPQGLVGADVTFPFVSVGATENLMMAASLAKGRTQLFNAAREPEIVDLANCLIAMWAQITGAGTDRIVIEGVDALHAAQHTVMADRIETGTYAMAIAATRGDATLVGALPETLGAAIEAMQAAGVIIDAVPNGMRIRCGALVGTDVMTE
ncbi:MAG TPA: UDP-N-acetylglucosamine 1-carboxyvinyltransferase, partial [Hyphomonas sp.]|nr:UDP-N-acetylglucosamine 1-carboxyvinyltransferase [Hyphomonas sp.]